MSLSLAGHCHCGAIRVELEPGRPTAELILSEKERETLARVTL